MDSHEERPVIPTRASRARRLIGLLAWTVAAIVGLGIIAFGIFFIVFVTHYGDRPPGPGLIVNNLTDETLSIFDVVGPRNEALAIEIPPETAKDSGIQCAAGTLVARGPDGELVARRGPFSSCNEDPWVIPATATWRSS